MNRHHQSRRSNSSIAPKAEPASSLPPPHQPHSSTTSPKNTRPTPSSHSNSPTNAGFSPAPSDNTSVRGSVGAPRPPVPQMPGAARQQMMQHSNGRPAPPASNSGASFYPTPAFQNHIEQLEQEYDAQADMVDDSEIETPGPGPYPANFNDAGSQVFPSPTSNGTGHQIQQQHDNHPPGTSSQYPSMTQLLDQNLDWDPFGLSASMAFPAQHYQFDQTNMR